MVTAWLPGTVRWQPYGRLRVRAVQICARGPGFCVVDERTVYVVTLGPCYILTKVEAASLSPPLASCKTLAIRPATQQPISCAQGVLRPVELTRGTARSGRAALVKFQHS